MFFSHAQFDIADAMLRLFEPYWFWATGLVILVLGIIGLSPVRLEADLGSHGTVGVYLRRTILGCFAALLTLGIGSIGMTYSRIGAELATPLMGVWAWRWIPFLVSCGVVGFIGRMVLHRYIQPKWSVFLKRFRIVQKTEQLSDIRAEMGSRQALDYLPSDYYQPDAIFVGLTPDGTPIYSDLEEWYETNKMVMGGTRFGKGIAFQIWMEQMIMRGDAVFYIDPKTDKWLPHVMRQAAERAGRRFIALDLVDARARGSWAPFVGGSAADRRARFFDVMDMEDRGTDADHYKALAREQIFDLFKDGANPTTIPALFAQAVKASEDVAALSTLRAKLRNWNSYQKLCPKPGKGFSVEASLLNNAVVYVRGSLDDAVIRSATLAFVMETIQEIRRLKEFRTTHCVLMLDELRFLLSDTYLKALATISGFDAQIIAAFQNYGDITSPQDTRLDGKSALQSVKINSQFKLVFGGTDAESAEDTAENSGTRMKKIVTQEQTEINRSGGETWARHRRMGEQEENFITQNAVLSLDKRMAVLLRVGKLAEIVSVAPIPVDRTVLLATPPSPAPTAALCPPPAPTVASMPQTASAAP